jgi:carboxymethylenebutenolidase
MDRKKASDFDQELLNLFDQYVHGAIDRRGFLDRAGKFAVGGMTASMLLDALSPRFAEAQQIAKDDARLKAEYTEYASPQGSGKMRGYLVRPAKAEGKLPGVLVVHENRGLNPHIEDIARRVALENFMAFAPDALFPLGGYPGDEDQARQLFPKLDQTKTREDFIAAAAWLKSRPDSTGKVGVVGFCYGGGIANMLHYAENDERINAGWPAYETALKASNLRYEAHIYPGTQHGFNNDTTPRYDKAAATLAWQRTIDFFNKHLRTS